MAWYSSFPIWFLCSFISLSRCWEMANHSPDCELELVQVIFRHGDRNPINPYPTDPYRNESLWPEGFGQLTKIGKMQQYEVGQYLRKRYDGFLSEVYSPYEISIQSSAIDRAIMSGQANLAGLYPPTDDQSRWNPDIKWQPIPVHDIPGSFDNTISLDERCPHYDEIFQDFERNSDVMQRIYKENQEIFRILTNRTGGDVTTIKSLDFIMDTLHIEKLYNKTWPAWVTELVSKYGPKLEELATFSFKMITYTTEMKRLKGGPLIKELTENMQAKRNQSMDSRRKFFMFSGHDTTVSTLLNSLDLFNDLSPPYRSMVIVELHRNLTSNKYFVEFLYRNSTEQEPFKLQIPGCEFSCDFQPYLDHVSGLIPSDWDKECQAAVSAGYDTIGIIVAVMLLVILVGLCIAVGLILKAYLRNKRSEPQPPKYPYLHLQMEDGGDGDEEH